MNVDHIGSQYIYSLVKKNGLSKGFLSWVRSNDKYLMNLYEQQALLLVDTTSDLVKIAETASTDLDKARDYLNEIRKREEEGDTIARKVFTSVGEQFVTPLDREDMSRLSTYIEEILNDTTKAADRFIILNVGKTSPEMSTHMKLLSAASREVLTLVSKLGKLKKARGILVDIDNIRRYNNQASELYEKALSSLFDSNDPIQIIKSKEIHDLIQNALSRCVDFTEIMEEMSLKYA